MALKIERSEAKAALRRLTLAGRERIAYGPNPLHNAGASASVFWGLVRRGIINARDGRLTPLGEAVLHLIKGGA